MSILASIFMSIASLPPDQAIEIGVKIWQNECNGTVSGLTSWNKGEEFASLGVGHFIWYPSNKRGLFQETFPDLVKYLKSQGVDLPRWIEEARGCPWKNYDEFNKARQSNSKQMAELRRVLQKTIPLQMQFIQSRVEQTLPTLFSQIGSEKKSRIETLYNRIIAAPNGHYVILDYINFKGDGTRQSERYNGQGWGLLQVLENMSDQNDADPIAEFVKSAKFLLEQRVKNAPRQRNEQGYLKGWFARLESYLKNS
jgi:hypothetical protein